MKRLVVEQARVKELLHYDETSGLFTWKKRPSNRVNIGDVAGSLDATSGARSGYRSIRLDGQLLRAHRLAWLYVHGVMPPDEIDHINGDRGDNRITNLRLATHTENTRNGRKLTPGLKGAHWRKHRSKAPWLSRIGKDGKYFHLGCFATAEEAHAAYVKAATEMFGEFARAR
jgi:hypothetical protein